MVRAEQELPLLIGPALSDIIYSAMASKLNDIEKKKRGRPPTDAKPVLVRLVPADLAPLDAYASDEAMTRPQAIRTILADWLRTHGYCQPSERQPAGPATDAVVAMDTAITKHRAKRR